MSRRSIADTFMRCEACDQIVRRRRTATPRPVSHILASGAPCRGYKRAPKGWSVKDADHIPTGERVMITANIDQHFKRWREVAAKLGVPPEANNLRPYGVVTRRYYTSGVYMVRLEGGGGTVIYTDEGVSVGAMSSTFKRDQLIWPIPESVLAFDPSVRTRRRRRAA